ncbi:MAG TPA: adenylate/guanylate cyclase domain-containing protein [Chlamydiales bacterium]|nr:adenylate/guanylate cyclase domain-containing protein [Chlamydiales bacterium]
MISRWFGKRKLRTEILVLFLFLLTVSSVVIISFVYTRNLQDIRRYSQETINRISALIIERMSCMLESMERLPQIGVGMFLRHPEVASENQPLISFFLDEVKYHPNLYAYYVGTPDGSALIVFNLSITDKPFYFGPSQRTPKGTVYAMMLVERSQGKDKEVWTYLDTDLKTISAEEIPSRGYDPRARPWYVGAVKEKKLFWTDVFTYDPTGDPGIAVAKPIYDEAGQLKAVIAADLSLNIFSQFLNSQTIGKKGKAFVLSESGQILIPVNEQNPIVSAAYAQFAKDQQNDFLLEIDGEKYLSSIHHFPASFAKNWLILIVDPLSDYFSEAFNTQRQMVLICLGILLVAAVLVIFFARHISRPIVILSREVNQITHLQLEKEVRVDSEIEEISLMDSSIAALRVAIRSFNKYVPREIVQELIEKKQEIVLGGEKKEIAILFADIVDFTPVADEYPIEMVTALLAEFFDVLSKVILKHGGTIDKYIGDCIMAFWGAPHTVENGERQACIAALECQEELAKLNQRRKERNRPEFHCRIGVNTGKAIVGNFGTQERMNYTAIGDSVNTAHRIEQINKTYHTAILIGEEVYLKIKDQFLVRPIDDVELKGKKNKLKVFELMALKEKATPQQRELASLFTEAFEAYHQGVNSQAQFQAILEKYPNDFPTQYYLNRLNP